jgi:hypothetical protein
MTTIHRPRPHTTSPARIGQWSPDPESRSPHQQPLARRVSNGIVASYLHDISARHTRTAPNRGVVAADEEEKGRFTPAFSAMR